MSDATHPPPPDEGPETDHGQLIDFPGGGRGASRLPETNLPLELTSFVGREREMAEIEGLLVEGTRLLTLTGSGGCGKTRLALAVATDLVEQFEDGVWWVDLASLSDPDLVPQAVAQALMIREEPGQPLVETLARDLASTELLLVLDNCEHLIEECAALTDALLRSCPKLRVIATSREALGIAGERAWLVPSLSLADPQHLAPLEELARYEAVKLFRERAKAINPTFELSEENAPAVARVCSRLEGMPLAIELAAARVRVLSVEQIASRLDDAFGLLKSESRTADPRQRTLRATIDWSYELLSGEEQTLFQRLCVFAGGFTLEAAEAVCTGEGVEEGEVLDLLSRLVDKSLVLVAERRGEEARYRLLETIRQYGQERLEESGEADEVRGRHAALFLTLAERAEPQLKGREQVAWLERLEREHDNLRAAMRWLLEEGGEIEAAVRLAWALWLFWWYHGHHAEGRRFADEMLEKRDALPIDLRAKAIWVRGIMSYGLESIERMNELFEESAALFRRVADDKSGLALALSGIGIAALQTGDMEPATALFEEALKLFREAANKWGVSNVLVDLGMVSLGRRDHERAVQYFEEALTISREIGDRLSGYISLYNLALASRALGEHERAAQLYVEGLKLAVEVGDKANTAYCMEGLAGLISERGEPEQATRLFGASAALLEAVGTPRYVQVQDRTSVESAVQALRSRLGEAAFTAAWAQGRAMTPEQAVEYALEEVQEPPALPTQQPTPPPVTGWVPAEAKVSPELGIFALGGARVEVGSHTLTSSDFGYAKPKELLFYLLSHPPRTREQIGLALWPDASPSKLRGSFHEALRHLRKALGGAQWIVHENKRYSFNRSLEGHYFFDVEAFESKLAEARKAKEEGSAAEAISHLKEAVGLYRGDFLEGFAAEGEWAFMRQEELRRSYQEALFTLGGLLVEEGNYSEAAQAYRKIIGMDRYSEAAHRELMRSEAALGERGRALEHYRSLVELLQKELGSSPAPETVALYEDIRRGEEV